MEGFAGIIGSLLGVAAEASAANDQKNLGYENLYETKRVNRQKEKLATSSQTDAQGNTVYYDPGLKAWKIKLSPQTKAIVGAQQAEQLESLTSDAKRNRDANIRKDNRSQEADAQFEKALTDYKYRPKKSEAQYIGDAQQEALLARRRGAAEAASAVNTALIRGGNGSQIDGVFKTARDADAEDFQQTLLGAKRQGEQDFLNTEGGKNGLAQNELEFLRGIADDTSDMPARFSDDNGRLSQQAREAEAGQLNTITSNEASRQSATALLSQALGKTPNFAPLASALGSIGHSGGGAAQAKAAAGTGDGEINPEWYQEMMRLGYMTPSSPNGF